MLREFGFGPKDSKDQAGLSPEEILKNTYRRTRTDRLSVALKLADRISVDKSIQCREMVVASNGVPQKEDTNEN